MTEQKRLEAETTPSPQAKRPYTKPRLVIIDLVSGSDGNKSMIFTEFTSTFGYQQGPS